MTWAKLDDRFWSNRKVRKAWRLCRASVGLHVMAITYCSMHETDGLVDPELVEGLLPNARERQQAVAALVAVGLWHEAEDDSYTLNDYLEFNPSSEQLSERRRRDAERKAQARGAPAPPASARTPGGHDADSGASPSGVQTESSRARPQPVPARPLEPPKPPTGGNGSKGIMFARRRVPEQRRELAERILAEFNRQVGTSYGAYTAQDKPSEDLKRILRALTDEQPPLDFDEAQRMIAWRLDHPYRGRWDGKPHAGAVFGPGAFASTRESAKEATAATNGQLEDELRRAEELRQQRREQEEARARASA